MKVYAIREKSTGNFMPVRKSAKGFTSDEPMSVDKCIPRLFKNKRAATSALKWWLEGKVEYRFTQATFVDPPDFDIKVHKMPHRKEENMEIIEMLLIEFNPRGKGKKLA